ncbi:MAG TPA: hypothetical protein VEA61_11670 [Allosphingosinicella sp.]|nr:hypothetical protein [Allosphingosinicella sp.]
MDLQVIKTFGQIAGIAGLALGVLLLLYRDIIRKTIFPKLDRNQAYRLLTLIAVLVWTIALAGMLAWVYTGGRGTEGPAPDQNWKRDLEVVLALEAPPTIGEADGTTFKIVNRSDYIAQLSSLTLQGSPDAVRRRDRLVQAISAGEGWNSNNPWAVKWTDAMQSQLADLKSQIRATAAARHVDVERVECLSGIVARC